MHSLITNILEYAYVYLNELFSMLETKSDGLESLHHGSLKIFIYNLSWETRQVLLNSYPLSCLDKKHNRRRQFRVPKLHRILKKRKLFPNFLVCINVGYKNV
jgi:hypothetical protein